MGAAGMGNILKGRQHRALDAWMHASALAAAALPCITMQTLYSVAHTQVLWDVASGEPICGAPMNSDFVLRAKFFNNDSSKIVTAGNYNLKVWTYDR